MAIWLLLLSCAGVVRVDDPTPDPPVPPDTAPPVTTTDVFTYEAPVVDVLFVIDASCSMAPKTAALIGSLQGMVDDWTAAGFDFHAGVVNIDESPVHGELVRVDGVGWADPSQANPGQMLMQLAAAVPDPSATESGRSAAYKALDWADEPGEANEGFLREGSEIAVIVHTDERDQSGSDPVNEAEFVNYMLGLREPERVAFHSIVGTEDYSNLSESIGGIVWSVDNTPYGPPLQAMTDTIDPTLLELSASPIESSLELRIVHADLTETMVDSDGYLYDDESNTVQMLTLPSSGDTVEITYELP